MAWEDRTPRSEVGHGAFGEQIGWPSQQAVRDTTAHEDETRPPVTRISTNQDLFQSYHPHADPYGRILAAAAASDSPRNAGHVGDAAARCHWDGLESTGQDIQLEWTPSVYSTDQRPSDLPMNLATGGTSLPGEARYGASLSPTMSSYGSVGSDVVVEASRGLIADASPHSMEVSLTVAGHAVHNCRVAVHRAASLPEQVNASSARHPWCDYDSAAAASSADQARFQLADQPSAPGRSPSSTILPRARSNSLTVHDQAGFEPTAGNQIRAEIQSAGARDRRPAAIQSTPPTAQVTQQNMVRSSLSTSGETNTPATGAERSPTEHQAKALNWLLTSGNYMRLGGLTVLAAELYSLDEISFSDRQYICGEKNIERHMRLLLEVVEQSLNEESFQTMLFALWKTKHRGYQRVANELREELTRTMPGIQIDWSKSKYDRMRGT